MSSTKVSGTSKIVQSVLKTPSASTTLSAASVGGSAMLPSQGYPLLPNSTFNAQGGGTYDLTTTVPAKDPRFSRGSKMLGRRGTVDVWFTAPESGVEAQWCVLVGGPTTLFTTTDLGHLRLGVDGTNNLTGLMQDAYGTSVVAFTDATIGALVEGRSYHVVYTWDADAGTVTVSLDGTLVDSADYGTDPSGTAWEAAHPTQLNLFKGSGGNRWSAGIEVVQVSR